MLLSSRGTKATLRVAIAAALALLSSAILAGRAGAVTYEPEPAFCKQMVIRDPASPFARMPKLHQPSESGRIGFGPPQLRLIATPGLRVSGGDVGFILGLAQRRGSSLPWTATTTLVEVNGRGRPTGRPQRTIRRVGWLKPHYGDRFQFEVADDPALYRTTILLTGASGQRLGKFSFYTQVSKAHPEARLNLNASSYRPESTVFMRVENLGNLAASYGGDYDVEKLEGSTWVEAPENPHGPMILIGLTAMPGASGPCNQFWIPPTTAPGSYRIAKEVTFPRPFVRGARPGKRKQIPKATLTAEFQVVP